MSSVITTVQGSLSGISEQQIYRFMGLSGTKPAAELAAAVEEVLPQFLSVVQCRGCYLTVPVEISGDVVNLGLFSVNSIHLAKNLHDCDKAVLFAATLGMAVEQHRRAAAVSSSVKALILDAMGSAGIEAYCNYLCLEIAARYPGYKPRPRFSPGYGDLPLSVQKQLLHVLDAQRKIGIAMTEGMLMIPQKSVTAIMGLGKAGCPKEKSDCGGCDIMDCEFRL